MFDEFEQFDFIDQQIFGRFRQTSPVDALDSDEGRPCTARRTRPGLDNLRTTTVSLHTVFLMRA